MATGVGLRQISLEQLNSPAPKNPAWCNNQGRIFYTSGVIANFLLKFSNFYYHGNRDKFQGQFLLPWQQGQISLTQLNSPTMKTSCLAQESGTYLPQKPSYSKFSV